MATFLPPVLSPLLTSLPPSPSLSHTPGSRAMYSQCQCRPQDLLATISSSGAIRNSNKKRTATDDRGKTNAAAATAPPVAPLPALPPPAWLLLLFTVALSLSVLSSCLVVVCGYLSVGASTEPFDSSPPDGRDLSTGREVLPRVHGAITGQVGDNG